MTLRRETKDRFEMKHAAVNVLTVYHSLYDNT